MSISDWLLVGFLVWLGLVALSGLVSIVFGSGSDRGHEEGPPL